MSLKWWNTDCNARHEEPGQRGQKEKDIKVLVHEEAATRLHVKPSKTDVWYNATR